MSTGELTRSFGWRDSEAFVQHDVQVWVVARAASCVKPCQGRCVTRSRRAMCPVVQECMSVIFEHLVTACVGTEISKHVVMDQQVGLPTSGLRAGAVFVTPLRVADVP